MTALTSMPSCILCGSPSKFRFTAGSTHYYQCGSCGVVFTNIVPQADYTEWSKSPGYTAREEYLTNVFSRIVRDIQRFKPTGHVLEIGSSLGYLLRVLCSVGFDAEGVEPSKFAVDYARERGLKVTHGYFEQSLYPPSSFDVVILNHVLEHISNPSELLHGVREILRDGGIILVSVPNFGSIEAQLFRQHWRFLMPQEHYLQFTPKTLSCLLLRNGFDVLDVITTVRFTELADPWREVARAALNDRKSLVYYLLEFVPAAFEQALGRGTGIQVFAAKTGGAARCS